MHSRNPVAVFLQVQLLDNHHWFTFSVVTVHTEVREVPEKHYYRMHCLTYCLTQPEHAAYLA